MYDINYLAILLSVIASMVIGSAWYGALFGKTFMKATGMDKMTKAQMEEMKKASGKTYAIQFVASIVTFVVLAMFMDKMGYSTAMEGMKMAFLIWFGFVMPVKLGEAIWGGSMTMFWLGSGNMLVTLLAAGAIIGAM